MKKQNRALLISATSILVAMILFIAGCKVPERKVTLTEKREYIILDFNPPKHVYIDLKEKVSGKVYEHEYISKHFSGWRDYITIGDTVTLTYEEYMYEGQAETHYDFPHLKEELMGE